MLWIKAFHIIAVVCWFAGLFYLPRLFVYHAGSRLHSRQLDFQQGLSDADATHNAAENSSAKSLFKIMERRLYYGIMWPAAILTTLFGIWLLFYNFQGYMTFGWMHLKLGFVLILWIYHLYCGHYMKQFKNNQNHHSQKFYRFFNEVPTLLLIGIVILVVVKP